MSMFLKVKDAFESTHHLPGYPGRCAAPHGHRWVVEIRIGADPGDLKDGMLIDFHRIQDVIKMYDHCDLNGIIKMPTAELLALDIIERIKLLMTQRDIRGTLQVELWESPGNSVQVEKLVGWPKTS